MECHKCKEYIEIINSFKQEELINQLEATLTSLQRNKREIDSAFDNVNDFEIIKEKKKIFRKEDFDQAWDENEEEGEQFQKFDQFKFYERIKQLFQEKKAHLYSVTPVNLIEAAKKLKGVLLTGCKYHLLFLKYEMTPRVRKAFKSIGYDIAELEPPK